MPTLDQHQSSNRTKALYIGDSGAGKTGSLVALARAGYKLRILDFDNGLDILAHEIRQEKNPDEIFKNVHFVTLTDEYRNGVPYKPSAWTRAQAYLRKWQEKDAEGNVIEDLGPASSWGSDSVLVIDSFTFAAKACLNYVLSTVGRLGQAPQLQDYGETVRILRDFLGELYSETIQCNTLVLAHVAYISSNSTGSEITTPYPAAVGKALPPEIGRYFNTVLKAKTTGSGQSTKHKIRTQPEGGLPLKNPAPELLDTEYDIEDGLSRIFQLLQHRGGEDVSKKAKKEPSKTPPK